MMNQISHCDPGRQDGAILPAWDMGFVPQVYRSCFGVFSHIITPLLYGWILASFFFARLWTETKPSSHFDLTLGQKPIYILSLQVMFVIYHMINLILC